MPPAIQGNLHERTVIGARKVISSKPLYIAWKVLMSASSPTEEVALRQSSSNTHHTPKIFQRRMLSIGGAYDMEITSSNPSLMSGFGL